MASKGKISLLFGMAAGAVTGLLLAPQKGKELRKKIAKERESGGIGHKALAQDLGVMAEEVSQLVKEVAKSDEVKRFWERTNETVGEWTEGNVDLDKWAKEANHKIDQLKKGVADYKREREDYLKHAKGIAQDTVKKAKTAKKKAKKAVKKVKATAVKAKKSAQTSAKKAKTSATKAKKTATKAVKATKAKTKKVTKAVKATVKKKTKKATAKKTSSKKTTKKKS